MVLLLIVSLVWAFSFGLIKGRLTGLDPTAVAVVRIAFAAALFLPFFRPGKVGKALALRLALIGAVQFGLMYILYLRAFQFLQGFEVALFTLTTPLYLALIEAGRRRRLETKHLAAALLAVLGAAVVLWKSLATPGFWAGFVLVQVSNGCFAVGQLAYRSARSGPARDTADRDLFALLYLGALAVSGLYSGFATDWSRFAPSGTQWAVLAYLGLIASGLCFFWWNLGATRVNPGTLAAFNNAKIPLGVACSLVFFQEQADLPRLLAGGALLILAVWLAERKVPARRAV
jgi:drug/metabolite transporter (DMT)-like permease